MTQKRIGRGLGGIPATEDPKSTISFMDGAGNSARSLRVAKRRGIPSVLEIPTWHRDKGKIKPREKVETSKA